MAKLDFIVNELNPKKDMEIIKASFMKENMEYSSFKENLEVNLKVSAVRLYGLAKPIIRGGICGAGVGALASAITGNDISTGVATGAWIGAGIDSIQYSSRAAYYGIKDLFG